MMMMMMMMMIVGEKESLKIHYQMHTRLGLLELFSVIVKQKLKDGTLLT